MGFRHLISLAFAFLFIFGAQKSALAQSESTAPIPNAADFAKSIDRNFTISPNGQFMAFLSGPNESAQLTLLDLQTGIENPIATGDKVKPRNLYFADNKHLIIDVSFYFDADKSAKSSDFRYEMFRPIVYNIETKKIAFLMPDERLEFNTLIQIVHIDSKQNRAIIQAYLRDNESFLNNEEIGYKMALYYSDLDTGKGKQLAIGNKKTVDFFLDNDGIPRFRLDVNYETKKTELLVQDGKNWERYSDLISGTELPFEFNGFLDNKTLLITEEIDGVYKLLKMDVETKAKELFSPNNNSSINNIIIEPSTKRPIGFDFENQNLPIFWLDENFGKIQKTLEKAFKGKMVTLIDWDSNHENFLVGVENGSNYPKVFLYNATNKQVGEVSIIPDAFNNAVLPEKTLHFFKASDGLEIPVYVTMPKNLQSPMPSIILPHGGPHASDSAGFDDLSQFLATRGYVVIQPQYRGSTGYGNDFMNAGEGEWAGKMQSDVNEAFDWAVAQKWSDPKRTCIVGASYGGYSALVGAAMTPKKYACAASYGGVFDLSAMQISVEAKTNADSPSVEYWRKNIGFSRYDTKQIHAISPIYFASNIQIPVQLIHGVEDTVVSIDQSLAMSKAMKKANIAHEYIEILGEDHWLSTQAGKTKYFQELERFLDGVLKPNN